MKHKRTVPQETLGRIVVAIDTDWSVASAAPAARGHHIVSHLTVEGGHGWSRRACVFKATTPEQTATWCVEARILAILAKHTSPPVPLSTGGCGKAPGVADTVFRRIGPLKCELDRTGLPEFTRPAVRALADSIGRYLAALLDLNAVDGFGTVTVDYRRQSGPRSTKNSTT